MNREGMWGPVTATLDWCELNYQFSHYIAEMANTMSNIFSILIAVFGIISSQKQSLPIRCTLASVWFSLVGVGSFFFHATLTFEAQLLDELPMIITASYNWFLLFDTERGFSTKSSRSRFLIAVLVAFNIVFSWSYYINRNPIYHQVVFASIMISFAFRVRYLLKSPKTSHLVPAKTRAEVARMFITGSLTFLTGFGIWNLDNIFCGVLTQWKAAIGWPVAFLLEGHSWWHILTGTGAYLIFVAINYLTLAIKDDHEKYSLAYVGGFIPYVVRVKGKLH